MSTFKPLQPKRSLLSTPAAPTSSLLRPSRPLVPTTPPASEPVAPTIHEQLERASRLGHSLEHISIFPPATRAAKVNKAEQGGAIATMQQAASTSVSASSTQRSPEAVPTEEHANSGHTPRFEYSFATIPLFPAVQRKAVLPFPLQEESQLGSRIQAARSSGHPLDKQTQQRLEQGIGRTLSRVRVHTDSEADHLSRSVNAVAFTTGPDIFFRSGMYRPHSTEGLHLLTHEAVHTLQQAVGPVAGTPHAEGVAISAPDDRFEQAAEMVATQATTGNISTARSRSLSALQAQFNQGETERQESASELQTSPRSSMEAQNNLISIQKVNLRSAVNSYNASVLPEQRINSKNLLRYNPIGRSSIVFGQATHVTVYPEGDPPNLTFSIFHVTTVQGERKHHFYFADDPPGILVKTYLIPGGRQENYASESWIKANQFAANFYTQVIGKDVTAESLDDQLRTLRGQPAQEEKGEEIPPQEPQAVVPDVQTTEGPEAQQSKEKSTSGPQPTVKTDEPFKGFALTPKKKSLFTYK